MSIQFRLAASADLPRVEAVFAHIFDRQEKGIDYNRWERGIYPTGEDARKALAQGTLYVGEEDGILGASAILNQIQIPEYGQVPWEIPAQAQEVFVIHTLCVDPAWSGRGVGAAFVSFAEEIGREKGCTVLRLDSFENNVPAQRLYLSQGYRMAGTMEVSFGREKKKRLIGFEKAL